MSAAFEREDRYVVLKRADVDAALSMTEKRQLQAIMQKIGGHRDRRGAAPMACVVVEADWPEHAPVWKAIEARMSGERGSLVFGRSLLVREQV